MLPLFECLNFKQVKPYYISQVIQGLLAVFFNLGDGDYNITLPYHRLDDGDWHDVELDRYGREFTLRLDGGGGRREVTASPGQSQEIIIDPQVVMLGNSFPSGHNRSFLGGWLFMYSLLGCEWKNRLNEDKWVKGWTNCEKSVDRVNECTGQFENRLIVQHTEMTGHINDSALSFTPYCCFCISQLDPNVFFLSFKADEKKSLKLIGI